MPQYRILAVEPQGRFEDDPIPEWFTVKGKEENIVTFLLEKFSTEQPEPPITTIRGYIEAQKNDEIEEFDSCGCVYQIMQGNTVLYKSNMQPIGIGDDVDADEWVRDTE